MATTANFNYFYRIDLTVKEYYNGAVTGRTYSFVNKPLIDSSGETAYWPILLAVGDITYQAGDPFPSLSVGSFTIDNRIGTFGANRKFLDVLERYTPVEQTVTVYVGEAPNGSNAVSSWTQRAQGVCTSYSASPGDGTLTFDVRGNTIRTHVLTLEVSNDVSGMESAPTSSQGRVVPLLFSGAIEVAPVRISADGAASPKYAYGTCLYQHTQNKTKSTTRLYTKNYLDEWEQFGVGENETSGHTNRSGETISGQYALNQFPAQAYGWGDAGYQQGLATGVLLTAKGNGTGGRVSNARLTVFVLRYDASTLQVVEEAASGQTDLTGYDDFNNAGTSSFPVYVMFNEPVHFSSAEERYKYALGWSVTGWAANELTLHYTSATDYRFAKDPTGAADTAGWAVSSGKNVLRAKFLGMTPYYIDHVDTRTEQGLTYSTVRLTSGVLWSGQVDPNFDNFPILVAPEGSYEYEGSETPSVEELVKLLDCDWDGGEWDANTRWDTTRYATEYGEYYASGGDAITGRKRAVIGVIDSRATFADVLAEICRTTVSKVGILSTGEHFLFPWGPTYAAAADIPPHDVTPTGWTVQDVSTVVSRVNVNIRASIFHRARQFESAVREGRFDVGYRYTSNFTHTNTFQVAALSAEARALYGDRPLAEVNFQLDPGDFAYIDGKPGSLHAEYFLSRFGKPFTYASFVVPYHRYSHLEMFDVVKFSHPQFPAFLGSDPDQPPPVYESGSTVQTTDPGKGQELVRAQRYRGLVEGITYFLPEGLPPSMRLTVLVLLNHPIDPT